MGIRSLVQLWASFVVLVAFCLPVAAAPQAGDKSAAAQQRKGSGLPIPRFASLRSDEVNVRTGPGPRYPIEWVFKRKSMRVPLGGVGRPAMVTFSDGKSCSSPSFSTKK